MSKSALSFDALIEQLSVSRETADAFWAYGALLEKWLQQLQQHELDFTLAFRALGDELGGEAEGVFVLPEALQPWLCDWRAALSAAKIDEASAQRTLRRANPLIIPRNHRIEQAIALASESDDFRLFHRLVEALKDPYTMRPDILDLAQAPEPQEEVLRTFCGT